MYNIRTSRFLCFFRSPSPYGPKHCCSIPPLYCNGDSLEEVLLAAFLLCCLAQALPNVPDEAECFLTEHTEHFHGKRDKVMADLQGGVLGILQMVSCRCHGPRLSGRGRQKHAKVRRCPGMWRPTQASYPTSTAKLSTRRGAFHRS